MIKHWRLFDNITKAQIKQLQSSNIFVRVEEDIAYVDLPSIKSYPILKKQDVFISTTKESQETILHIMFPGTVKLIGYNNDYEQ